MVSELPFKLCSPMKKSTGPGDFQGTLQGKVEYIAVRALGIVALKRQSWHEVMHS
jgi:hypothetical protein